MKQKWKENWELGENIFFFLECVHCRNCCSNYSFHSAWYFFYRAFGHSAFTAVYTHTFDSF